MQKKQGCPVFQKSGEKMINRVKLRKEIREARRTLSFDAQQRASQQIMPFLVTHPSVINAKNIAIFLNHDGEIGTQLFIKWCWENDKSVYLPVIHPFSKHHLLFLKYSSETKLIKNKYGILDPKLNVTTLIHPSQLDIIFTPLVAFDKQGNRIGMGGGYYDRLLQPFHTTKIGPYPIGLAHDCQLIAKVPIDSWDIPLPEIITPSQHHIFKNNTN
jgi:5-formyltetrahydrofolate cyclo-ligase